MPTHSLSGICMDRPARLHVPLRSHVRNRCMQQKLSVACQSALHPLGVDGCEDVYVDLAINTVVVNLPATDLLSNPREGRLVSKAYGAPTNGASRCCLSRGRWYLDDISPRG